MCPFDASEQLHAEALRLAGRYRRTTVSCARSAEDDFPDFEPIALGPNLDDAPIWRVFVKVSAAVFIIKFIFNFSLTFTARSRSESGQDLLR